MVNWYYSEYLNIVHFINHFSTYNPIEKDCDSNEMTFKNIFNKYMKLYAF